MNCFKGFIGSSRLFFVVSLLLFAAFPAFTAKGPSEFFASIHNESSYPVEEKIGALCDYDSDEDHEFLYQALSSEFSVDWCEENFDADMKVPLTKVFSPFLASHMPQTDMLCGKGITNGDSSRSIPVKFSDGSFATFTVLNKKIVAIDVPDDVIFGYEYN